MALQQMNELRFGGCELERYLLSFHKSQEVKVPIMDDGELQHHFTYLWLAMKECTRRKEAL